MRVMVLAFITLFVSTFFTCSPSNDHALDDIVNLYGGEFSLVYGLKVNHNAKGYVRIISENNELITNGILSAQAMANNCAVIFADSNSKIFKREDVLEVKIVSPQREELFSYTNDDLAKLRRNYRKVDTVISKFVGTVKSGNVSQSKKLIEINERVSKNQLDSFLYNFKRTIQPDSDSTRIIGYKELPGENLYAIDFVIIDHKGIKKIVNATLVVNQGSFQFRELNF